MTPILQLAVDRDARVPLQRQLYEQLRGLILDGRLAGGARLPATRTLARDVGVSRNTALAVYDQLLAEGYVEGRVGAGTFAAAELPEVAPLKPPAAPAPIRPARALSRRGRALAALARPRGSRHMAFATGLPALDAFPHETWARLLARSWRRPGADQLAFGDPAGWRPLRAAIAAYLRQARAVDCDPERIVIVSGAQQGIGLAARALADHGETAWLEDPGYPGVEGALAGAGLALARIPIDGEGIDIAGAAAVLKPARLVCVTPSHHYPTGVTMSLNRRLRLLQWAADNDAWILEDDYDSEYRYSGRPLAALQGLDRANRVIYIGSFSKVMFPSLRIGYLIVPEDLIEPVRRARAALDDHPSSIAQPALARFIEEGHFSSHIRRMRRLYAGRQALLIGAARRHLGGLLMVPPTAAGMHLVAWPEPALQARLPDREIARLAATAGLTVLALSPFYRAAPPRQGLLLGFAAVPEAAMEPAIARLAALLATGSGLAIS